MQNCGQSIRICINPVLVLFAINPRKTKLGLMEVTLWKWKGIATERTSLWESQQGVIRCESRSQRGLCDSKYQWLDERHRKSERWDGLEEKADSSSWKVWEMPWAMPPSSLDIGSEILQYVYVPLYVWLCVHVCVCVCVCVGVIHAKLTVE